MRMSPPISRSLRPSKVMGQKRQVLVDTHGLLMHAIVHAADIHDRDGGAALMATWFGAFPFLTRLFGTAAIVACDFRPPSDKFWRR